MFFSTKKSVRRFDRETMLTLADSTASRTRPMALSSQFNDEEGKFSPERWLVELWNVEEKEGRLGARRKADKLKAEGETAESTILSPQRRGFSSGCRPPSPRTTEIHGGDRNPVAKNWRPGAVINSSKQTMGLDFKPNFQRLGSQNGADRQRGAVWRATTSSGDNFRPYFGRENSAPERSQNGRNNTNRSNFERMPEWVSEGPATMSEIMDLKGFDEDANEERERRTGEQRHSKNKEQDRSSPVNESNSRPQSVPNSGNATGLSNWAIPNSDAEMAAILGILDEEEPIEPLPSTQIAPSTSNSSRLSRFFAGSSSTPGPAPATRCGITGSQQSSSGPSALQAIFDSSLLRNQHNDNPQTSFPGANQLRGGIALEDLERNPQTSFPGANNLRGGIALEDLERNPQTSFPAANQLRGGIALEDLERNPQTSFPGANQLRGGIALEDLERNLKSTGQHEGNPHCQPTNEGTKGDPLSDPQQQARLLLGLSRVERSRSTTDETRSSPQVDYPHFVAPSMPPAMEGMPGMKGMPAMEGMPGMNDPMMLNAALQYQAALMQNLAATNAFNANSRMPMSVQPGSSSVSGQGRPSAGSAVASGFMPTSVMRQMTTSRTMGMSPENVGRIAAAESMRGPIDQRQQQYNAVVNAMQAGLPMSAWRLPAAMTQQQQQQQQQAMRNGNLQHQQQQQHQQMAYALMRGDPMAVAALQRLVAGQSVPSPSTTSHFVQPQQPIEQRDIPIRQNPLELLLRSAGHGSSMTTGSSTAGAQPAILSRLPPSAAPISLEELERQLAGSSM